jgi:hypothetical protein
VRIVGISVDPPSHSVAMVEKLELPFPLLSDARGELGKLYGVWNEDEGVEVPSIIVVDKSGEIRHLYSGSDFADRPGDEEIFETLDGLEDSGEYGQEPQVSISSEEANEESVRPEKPAMTLEQLVPYYRGIYFTTVAFKKRFGEGRNKEALDEVGAFQKLTNGYSAALQETRKLKSA